MRTTCAAAPPFHPQRYCPWGGSPQRRACAAPAPRGVAHSRPRRHAQNTHASSQPRPHDEKNTRRAQTKPVTDLQHNAANRVDTAHAHEYTKGKMLELAGFMKHLHDGIPIRRHLENGREDKICIRGAGEAGDDGVAWDGLCLSLIHI